MNFQKISQLFQKFVQILGIYGEVGLAGEDYRRKNFLNLFTVFMFGWIAFFTMLAGAYTKNTFPILGTIILIISMILFAVLTFWGALGMFIQSKPFIDSLLPYQVICYGPAFMVDGLVPKGKKPYWYKGFLTKEKTMNFIEENNNLKITEVRNNGHCILIYDHNAE